VIDLNCDMGEGFGRWALGDDARLIGAVTSASIACGFHAGDPRTMDATVALAAAAGVSIGAHVAYPDLVGFGRRQLTVSVEQLVTDVIFQVGALQAFCTRHHTSVRYVKAHGALYNDLAEDAELAGGLADAVLALNAGLAVLTLAGSPSLAVMRDRGIPVFAEAFADRAYTAEGRLVPRSQPGAVISDPESVAERACRIAAGEPIDSRDGSPIVIEAASLCVHGDSPDAVALATAVRDALTSAGVGLTAFADPP
jgi:UPF0271 protein